MDFLGDPWISFGGLVCDFIGFAILAIDLIPKYRISKSLMIAKSKLAAGHRIEDGILGTQEPKTANVRYWNQISHGVFERRKDFSPKELDLIKEAEEWNKSHGLTEEGFQREKTQTRVCAYSERIWD